MSASDEISGPRAAAAARPLRAAAALAAAELEALDRASIRPGAGYRGVAVALCTAPLCLMLLRYFGTPGAFERVWGAPSLTGDRQLDAYLYWSLACVACYAVIPWVTLRAFGLGGVRDLGVAWAGFGRHLPLYAAMFLPVLAGIVAASGTGEFQRVYPFYKIEQGSAGGLLAFELVYALQFFALEFFFRGYLVHVPKRKLGAAAVFVMIVPYCMIHFQKPLPEALASVAGGLALGFVSLRTGTILGGCLIHVLVAWSMDFMSLYQQGRLPELPRAIGWLAGR